METIGSILQANNPSTSTPCGASLPAVSNEQKEWLTKWKDPSEIEKAFSPAVWGYVSCHIEKAYSASCPTLGAYRNLYGEEAAVDWIHLQILALFGSSSSREAGLADGIRIFAQSFLSEVREFKLTEMLLFFSRYKAGRYDHSYATFDSRRIGNAFFKEFLVSRARELDLIERANVRQESEKKQFVPPQGYSSLGWYHEVKRRAANGDKEALLLLQPPE